MQQVNLPKQNKPINSSVKNVSTTINSQKAVTQGTNKSSLQDINQSQNISNNTNQQDKQVNNTMNSQNLSGGLNNFRQQPPKDNFSDPWGSAWDDPWGSKPQKSEKKLTPQERTEMITKVYQDILGREPDTRDINYYKYSTLGENEIYKQIITGKEHKKLIADGKDFKNMSIRASQSEVRVKVLEGQIKDQVVEFRQLTELLQEKNRYINQLRASSHNPYSFTTHTVDTVKQGNIHYSQEHREQNTQNNIPQISQKMNPTTVLNNPPNNQANIQSLDQSTNQFIQSAQSSNELSSRPQLQPQSNRIQSPPQSDNSSNVQFGNAQLNTTTSIKKKVKKSKIKEFLKTVLDL